MSNVRFWFNQNRISVLVGQLYGWLVGLSPPPSLTFTLIFTLIFTHFPCNNRSFAKRKASISCIRGLLRALMDFSILGIRDKTWVAHESLPQFWFWAFYLILRPQISRFCGFSKTSLFSFISFTFHSKTLVFYLFHLFHLFHCFTISLL